MCSHNVIVIFITVILLFSGICQCAAEGDLSKSYNQKRKIYTDDEYIAISKRMAHRTVIPEINIQDLELEKAVDLIVIKVNEIIAKNNIMDFEFVATCVNNKNHKVSIRVENIPISELLFFICEQANLSYSYSENGIVLHK